jgi:hypothetical protein
LEAVLEEIEAKMTADQLTAIAAMEFSQAEIAAVTHGASGADAGAGVQSSPAAMDPALGFQVGAGMAPDGGGMPMDGSTPGGSASSGSGSGTTEAARPELYSMVSAAPFQRVVALLQSKVQS